MLSYPDILLPKKTFPILKNKDVLENAFVRETIVDVYQFLSKSGFESDDIIPLVVAPQPSLNYGSKIMQVSIFLVKKATHT